MEPKRPDNINQFFLHKDNNLDQEIFNELEKMPQKLNQYHTELEPDINIKA